MRDLRLSAPLRYTDLDAASFKCHPGDLLALVIIHFITIPVYIAGPLMDLSLGRVGYVRPQLFPVVDPNFGRSCALRWNGNIECSLPPA